MTEPTAASTLSRRRVLQLSAVAAAAVQVPVYAFDLGSILQGSQSGAAQGGAQNMLAQAVDVAVAQLGQTDGFMGNDLVRIGLPGHLDSAAKLLKRLGQGKKVDELLLAMNRSAEQVMPLAKPIILDAVNSMDWRDAQGILTGGDTAVTDFFADKTRSPLSEKLLPLVTETVGKHNLAQQYNALAGKVKGLGVVPEADNTAEAYVTRKALDGLYAVMAQQEKNLRANPIGAGMELLEKMMGGK